jgi:hypothetical protein
MAHTTAITIRFIAPYTLTWIPAQSNRQLCRLRNDGLFDPLSLDAGIYDDCLAILTRHHETIEDSRAATPAKPISGSMYDFSC